MNEKFLENTTLILRGDVFSLWHSESLINVHFFRLLSVILHRTELRTLERKFSNIDFFLKILPLKDDELVLSEM